MSLLSPEWSSRLPGASGTTTTKVVPGADGELQVGAMRIRPTRPGSAVWPVCHDLRGDREGLPRFPWDRVTDWDEVDQAFTDYVAASRRLRDRGGAPPAYVALTRARTDLLLTSHVWGSASTPDCPHAS